MPREFALLICVSMISWLFIRDRKLRPMPSAAVWIPLLWVFMLGSRPITMWSVGNYSTIPDNLNAYEEGSIIDRNVYSALIIVALSVLSGRKFQWGEVVTSNRWVWAFFGYCAISILWSDYPFVGIKRWIKDFGNVVMILIILTEADPILAVKAVFARYSYLVILLSVLFIKYYPELGRYYSRWTYMPVYSGVATEKNALGAAVLVAILLLLWDLCEALEARKGKRNKLDLAARLVLLGMALWLEKMADSSAAIVASFLGGLIILLMRYPVFARRIKYIGSYVLIMLVVGLLLYTSPAASQLLLGSIGEDITLTGRTDIWADLFLVPINPVIGVGYQSFWLGEHVEAIWKKYYFHPNQAHNGYIETYLNGGVVGLLVLLSVIIAVVANLKPQLIARDKYAILRFAFLVVAVLYNMTEAMFNRLSPVWFIFLLAVICPLHRAGRVSQIRPRVPVQLVR